MSKKLVKHQIENSDNMRVKDLRQGITQLGLSPEEFAKQTPISNMTVRRILRKSDNEIVPEKHAVHFTAAFLGEVKRGAPATDLNDMNSVMDHLVQLSRQVESKDQLKSDLDEKVKGRKFDENFLGLVKELKSVAFQKKNLSVSFIAIGALIYFINPIDLIPDYLFPLGYVDDFGIMSLAVIKIRSILRQNPIS
jgi:uncharacterized membrane protein YkvA (DUF1232 family)